MKSKLTVLFLFYTFILNAQIAFKILNKKIVENQNVDFVIKNNSKENYYILIDTLFLANAKFDNDYFMNPYFVLVDKENNEVPKISNISERSSSADLKTIDHDLTLLEIKSKQNLHFKIPFKIERKINSKQTDYFLVDRKKKYYASLQYKLTEKFVNMEYIKKRIELVKKKNCKVFIGTLESAKIPIVFIN